MAIYRCPSNLITKTELNAAIQNKKTDQTCVPYILCTGRVTADSSRIFIKLSVQLLFNGLIGCFMFICLIFLRTTNPGFGGMLFQTGTI